MAYWLTPMICIVLEEHLFFKRKLPVDWNAWANPKQMPIGIAALTAFLLGWVGAILGMSEVYYIGPLAVKSNYADVGVWVAIGFTMISFPPLRYLEIKKFGR